MQTTLELLDTFKKVTKDASTTNDTWGKRMISETRLLIFDEDDWIFNEVTGTLTTTASMSSGVLPYDYLRMGAVKIAVGGNQWPVIEMPSRDIWLKINIDPGTSDYPYYYFIEHGNIKFFQPISSAALTVTMYYQKKLDEMTFPANYTTGTVSITANGTALVGVGTTFTAAMVGRYIKIGTTHNYWYKITAFTDATHITISPGYGGGAVTGGSHQISELPAGNLPIPDGYQDMLWMRPASLYFMAKGDIKRASFFMGRDEKANTPFGQYDILLETMRKRYRSRTSETIQRDFSKYRRNFKSFDPNKFPTLVNL